MVISIIPKGPGIIPPVTPCNSPGEYSAVLGNLPCTGQQLTVGVVIDSLQIACTGTTPARADGSVIGSATFTILAGTQPVFGPGTYTVGVPFTIEGSSEVGSEELYDFTGVSTQGYCDVPEIQSPVLQQVKVVDCEPGVPGYITYKATGGAAPYYFVYTVGHDGAPCEGTADTLGPIAAGDSVNIYECDATICMYVYSDPGCSSDIMESGIYTGIPGMALTDPAAMVVFPNPASDEATFRLPEAGVWQIDILNSQGQVSECFRTPPGAKEASRRLSPPDGTYFIRATHAATGHVRTGRLSVVQ